MRGHERLQVICIEEIDHGVLIIYSVDVSEGFQVEKKEIKCNVEEWVCIEINGEA